MMSEYTEVDYAWAAGFLDGEGCFTLTKGSSRSINHPATRTPVVCASQINPEPLEKLAAMFGGRVRKMRINGRGQQINQWALGSADDIRNMIPLVLPYLVSKRTEAEIVLSYSKWVRRRGAIPYSTHEAFARFILVKRLERIRAT